MMIQSMGRILETTYCFLINSICLDAVLPTPNAADLPWAQGKIALLDIAKLHISS